MRLRGVQRGWTRDLRKDYFGWLNRMLQTQGGKSFAGYIREIREDAIDALPAEDKASVAWLIGDVEPVDQAALPQAKGPGEAWTAERVVAVGAAARRAAAGAALPAPTTKRPRRRTLHPRRRRRRGGRRRRRRCHRRRARLRR